VIRQEDLKAIQADRAERAKQDAAKKAVGKAKRGQLKAITQANRGEEGKKRDRKRTVASTIDFRSPYILRVYRTDQQLKPYHICINASQGLL
jgi:hypothetical protein